MPDGSAPLLHLGGPDQPARHLRNILRARIDAVPSGGEIAWATYYFRDRDLASALIEAARRGVHVTIQVEGRPRRRRANMAVLEMLKGGALRSGLHIHGPPFSVVHPHLHSKIYYFSHPQPAVIVGSFNPSGDEPEDPDVTAEIGDQDRGHNILVELRDAPFAEALRDHVRRLHWPFRRLRNRRPIVGRDATAWFFPRFDPSLVEPSILGARSICGCISHLNAGPVPQALARAAKSGARVRLMVHDTERRVPGAAVAALQSAGVEIRRYRHPEYLPLHAKFVVADRTVWFGSFNYNPTSRWLNDEVLLASEDDELRAALLRRFEEIAEESAYAGAKGPYSA